MSCVCSARLQANLIRAELLAFDLYPGGVSLLLHLLSWLLNLAIILGFPGESEEAHQEVVEFARTFKFERAGAFAYSEEDGTPAADLPEQVSSRIRYTELVHLCFRAAAHRMFAAGVF